LLPLPSVVAAAPAVGKQKFGRSAELLPLPSVVAAAPAVGKQKFGRSAELLPLPSVVTAAPAIGQQNLVQSAKLLPLPSVVAAAPAIGQQNLVQSAELLPLPSVVAAAPAIGRQNLVQSAELLLLPSVVAAAPAVGRQNLFRSAELPAPPSMVPIVPAAGKQVWLHEAVLQPLTDKLDAAGEVAVSTQSSPIVTYRDGQLTIDAGNSTLAEVLKLVAEKTGAVIDVPPGAGLERIVEHTGPGRADDVLSRLLNGSPFDFIIVGSSQRPHELTQVLLSLHRADAHASPPPAQLPTPVTSSVLWTPPAEAPTAAVLPYALDSRNLEPPKEPLPPETLGKMMRERGQQLREQIQQQQPQQQ
jgi:hypothetical protein